MLALTKNNSSVKSPANSNMTTNSSSESTVLILGATGLVGSHFLKEAQESAFITKIITISRRALPTFNNLSKVTSIVNNDVTEWERLIQDLEPFDIVFSGIGTTKGEAKGFNNQKLIDHDLTVNLATAAKKRGAKVFVMASSFNNRLLSTWVPYFRLKNQVEQDIQNLGFNKTIFLKPGPLVGDRTVLKPEQTYASQLSSAIANFTYNTPCSSLFGFSIKAEEVAEAAMYLVETNSYMDRVKYITSEEMFDLAHALESI